MMYITLFLQLSFEICLYFRDFPCALFKSVPTLSSNQTFPYNFNSVQSTSVYLMEPGIHYKNTFTESDTNRVVYFRNVLFALQLQMSASTQSVPKPPSPASLTPRLQ